MNILYTTDRNYIDIMLASIYSLIQNSNFEEFNFHIVTFDFSNEDYDRVKRLLECFKNVNVNFYKLEDYPINNLNIPSWRGSQIANARLIFPSIIRDLKDIDDLLYIDSDTIIRDDLTEIIDYKDSIVSACKEDCTLKSYYVDKLNLDRYFNSGVIYFNTKEWNKLDIEYRIKDTISNPNIDITYPDQDLFNIMLKDEIGVLPNRFNISTYPFLFNKIEAKLFYNPKYRQLGYDEIIKEKNRAKILHSYGLLNIKPWCDTNFNPFSEEFMMYIHDFNKDFTKTELSTFKKILTTSPTLIKLLIISKTYLPKSIEEKNRQLSLKLQKAREK